MNSLEQQDIWTTWLRKDFPTATGKGQQALQSLAHRLRTIRLCKERWHLSWQKQKHYWSHRDLLSHIKLLSSPSLAFHSTLQYSHSTPQPTFNELQMGRVCATHASVLKDLHLDRLPCVLNPTCIVGLFCNAFTGPCSYITPKAEKEEKEDKAISF